MIRGLKFTTKGGPGSGHHGHSGIPGQVGGSASSSGVSVTTTQYKEISKQLKARVEWMRGKIYISFVEPIKEPKQTQRIHVLATTETTAAKAKRWKVTDLPELVRHPNSIGNLSMRIGRLVPRRGATPDVYKFKF